MKDRPVWFSLVFIVTLAAALIGYYYVHKPITPFQALALASTLVNVGVAWALTLLGGGLGRRLLRGWLIGSPGERITVQAALGWGAMGLVMLGLGLVRLYYSAVLWGLILLALFVLWKDVRGWLADSFVALRVLWQPDLFSRLAFAFVSFILVIGLLQALAPPLAWDALAYHLTLPKLYAQAHQVQVDADILFTGMPQITEMLYTAATLLRGAIAAQMLGWVFGVMLALGLAAHTAEVLSDDLAQGGGRFAALAPAILFSSFTVATVVSWAYSDVLLMLLALALLITLRKWRLSRDARWIRLSGVLAGLAAGCKYTGVQVPVAGAAMLAVALWQAERSLGVRYWLKHYLMILIPYAGFALAVLAPWLIKNWVFTGNPTYPLLFPTDSVDALRLWFYSRPDLTERNPFWAALMFLRATFLGRQGATDYDVTLGPLFVILVFGLALGWRKLNRPVRRELGPLAGFAVADYACWVLLTFVSSYARQGRLFLALLPALAILAVAGIQAIASFNTLRLRVSVILNAMLVFVLSLSALESWNDFLTHDPLAYLAGTQSATDYGIANQGGYVMAMDWINQLPAGSRIEFLWEARAFDCAAHVRCEPDVVIDRWWHLRRTLETASAILSSWKARGVTHVLIFEAGVNYVRAEPDNGFADSDWVELDALREKMELAQSIQGAYSLYALP